MQVVLLGRVKTGPAARTFRRLDPEPHPVADPFRPACLALFVELGDLLDAGDAEVGLHGQRLGAPPRRLERGPLRLLPALAGRVRSLADHFDVSESFVAHSRGSYPVSRFPWPGYLSFRRRFNAPSPRKGTEMSGIRSIAFSRVLGLVLALVLALALAAPAAAAPQKPRLIVEPGAGTQRILVDVEVGNGQVRRSLLRVTPAAVTPGATGWDPAGRAAFVTWQENGERWFSAARDAARTWSEPRAIATTLRLRAGAAEPGRPMPAVAASLALPPEGRLFVVQFRTLGLPEWRDALQNAGAEVLSYLPFNAHIVRVHPALVPALAALDFVLWIDRWSAPENDMDLVRADSGANWSETNYNTCGQGVRGEVLDGGFESTHMDFDGVLLHGSNSAASHGTSTYGIVFGNGNRDGDGNAQGTGQLVCSGVQGIAADYDFMTDRFAETQQLKVSPYFASFQSNSWGDALTTQYTSISNQMDDIIWRLDIAIAQSQSNAGTQQSRPQAWAKNIF